MLNGFKLLGCVLLYAVVGGLLSASQVWALNSGAAVGIFSYKVLFHGALTVQTSKPLALDGEHSFHVRVFGTDGSLVHDETMNADVRAGSYDLLLGSSAPLVANLSEEYDIAISMDKGPEMRTRSKLSAYVLINDAALSGALQEMDDRLYRPLDNEEISAQMAEHIASRRGLLTTANFRYPQLLPFTPLSGLSFEMSIAPPADRTPTDYYNLAKYGRLAIEYNNFFSIGVNKLGFAAQALHVAHHLLFYGAGLTSDINGDGMLLMTAGIAHYQSGNARNEPFVDAPFMRLKYKSDNGPVFAYGEIETTMHIRSYTSGMAGLGMRVARGVQLIGGFHHTEFVMPTEHEVRIVEGLQGIMRIGI